MANTDAVVVAFTTISTTNKTQPSCTRLSKMTDCSKRSRLHVTTKQQQQNKDKQQCVYGCFNNFVAS
jgi:hypothetical protein